MNTTVLRGVTSCSLVVIVILEKCAESISWVEE
jgi:hypothetical protein